MKIRTWNASEFNHTIEWEHGADMTFCKCTRIQTLLHMLIDIAVCITLTDLHKLLIHGWLFDLVWIWAQVRPEKRILHWTINHI